MATQNVSRPSGGAIGARVVLTFLGAAGLIVGGLLKWLGTIKADHIKYDVFYAKNPDLTNTFVISAGFIMVVLGCLAVLGLAERSGWLTRLAGALGLVGFVLFAVNVYRRTSLNFGDFKVGIWLCLAGGVLALIGGFFHMRTATVAGAPAATAPPPPPPA